MLSSNVKGYMYFPGMLRLCISYGIDSRNLKKNYTSDATKNFKPSEPAIKEKVKLKKSTDMKRLTANIIEPKLENKRRKEIQNVVGIHFGPKSLYWAKINRNRYVEEWKSVDLYPSADVGRKLQLHKIYAMMDCVSENIPFSDIFVLEASNQSMLTSMSSPAVIGSAILRSQMLAILLTILNLRLEDEDNPEDYYHKVFLLKPKIVSRFFNLLVGTERVSALALVEFLLGIREPSPSLFISKMNANVQSKINENATSNADTLQKNLPSTYTPIEAPSSIIKSYCALEAVEKEAMGQALLITMAFYDLVVFEDSVILPSKEK